MRSHYVVNSRIAFARVVALGLSGLLSLFSLSMTYAATLPLGDAGAMAVCGAISGGRLENSYMGSVPGRYPCAANAYGPCATHAAKGAARATFGFQTGFARVQGSAKTYVDPDCPGVPSGGSYLELTASAAYWLHLPLVAIPPPGYTGQPVPMIVRGSLSGLSEGNAGFGATLRIDGPGVNEAWEANSLGQSNVTIVAPIYMAIEQSYGVSLFANCGANTGAFGPFDSRCAATADPTFEFDQAAFDAMMGDDTFPLADYFAIEFSENLIATPLGVDIAKFTNFNRSVDPYEATVPRVAPGETVSWIYDVENMGETPIAAADLLVTDSDSGLTPVLDLTSDDGDLILSPLESWEYTASATALDLAAPPPGITVVTGCGDGRNTYENTARVEIMGTEIFDEDVGHYCNDVAVVDTDHDGIRDEQDNCINEPNGPLDLDAGDNSQRDTDGDGYGNVCDPDFPAGGAFGIVDAIDFSLMKANLGSTTQPDMDLNGNGIVDPTDFSITKAYFGKPPGPSCADLPGGCAP